jgi:hypothetical protein
MLKICYVETSIRFEDLSVTKNNQLILAAFININYKLKEDKMKEDVIERLGYGVMADRDETPDVFTNSDKFLIVDLKNRKDIVFEEYRENPHIEIIKKKYPMPTGLGGKVSDEEFQIYMDIAEILKDCKYVSGGYTGYFPKVAFEKQGVFYVMQAEKRLPRDDLERLIGNRVLAGFSR